MVIDLNDFLGFDPACTALEHGQDVADWLDRLPDTYGDPDRRTLLLQIAETASDEGWKSPGWLGSRLPKQRKELAIGRICVEVNPERYGNLVTPNSPVTKTDEAARWILDVLSDGPIRSPDLHVAAKAKGVRSKTLRDARDLLRRKGNLEFRREGGGQSWILTESGQAAAAAKGKVEGRPRSPLKRPR